MKFLSIILVLALLTGCNIYNYSENNTLEETSTKSQSLIPYNLYVKNTDYILSKYEPTSSVYLGSYIQFENNPEVSVESFENQVNNTHTIYSHQLRLDEPFPLSLVLAYYSKGKTPFITILPPENEEDTFNLELLKNLAQEFGNLKIPMFVNFYENPHLNNYNESNYISFFKQAKIYFQTYAPNVAFVWSIDSSNVYEISKYYPGDSYVDWVGINIYENIQEDDTIKKVLTELDYFYTKFQNKKPISISSLGILFS